MEMLGFEPESSANFVITGDWHINLSKHPEWHRDRLFKLVDSIAKTLSRKHNYYKIVVLNGDIFDRATPTLEEIGLFYELLTYLKESLVDKPLHILLLAGNHEVLSKKQTTFDFLPRTAMFHYAKCALVTFGDTWFHLVGHPYIKYIEPNTVLGKKNILFSHYRSELQFAAPEVDNDIVSKKYNLTILSDIHYDYSPRENIHYTSSPFSTKFIEVDSFTLEPSVVYGFYELSYSAGKISHKMTALDLPSKFKCTLNKEEEIITFINAIREQTTNHIYKVVLSFTPSSELLSQLKAEEKIVNVVIQDATPVEIDTDTSEIVDELREGNTEGLLEIILNNIDVPETNKEQYLQTLRGLLC